MQCANTRKTLIWFIDLLQHSGEINNRSARATLTVVIDSKSVYAFVNVDTQNWRQQTYGNYRSINLIPFLLFSVPTLYIIVYFSYNVLIK
jgi:hypothetical protein